VGIIEKNVPVGVLLLHSFL